MTMARILCVAGLIVMLMQFGCSGGGNSKDAGPTADLPVIDASEDSRAQADNRNTDLADAQAGPADVSTFDLVEDGSVLPDIVELASPPDSNISPDVYLSDTGVDVSEPEISVVEVAKDTFVPMDFDEYYFPPTEKGNDYWESIEPELLGWNGQEIQELVQLVKGSNSTGLLVLYKGRIVVEEYWDGWDQHTSKVMYSASKSVVAVLVGRAKQLGLLKLTDKVTDILGQGWSNAVPLVENQVTVLNLLTMTSGLNKLLTFEKQAGKLWKYNTTAYNKLHEVLEEVTGQGMAIVAAVGITNPLGMHDSLWVGNFMKCSVRDMARFGLMTLAGGEWAGKPLLIGQAYYNAMLNSSQDLNPAYGYLWWLNGKGSWVHPDGSTGEGYLLPEAPADMVAALGYADKKIYVVPSEHLVVVRHGEAADEDQPALSDFDSELWVKLLAAIP